MKSWAKIDGALADYVDDNWLRESAVKRRLREETARLPQAGMQISAHQGQQLTLMARAIGARRAVEVGRRRAGGAGGQQDDGRSHHPAAGIAGETGHDRAPVGDAAIMADVL